MTKLRFDVQKDLKLVRLVSLDAARAGGALLARGRLARRAVALAKAQPGKLTYASSGSGGAIHLASELFKRETGIDIVHVPFRGGGPAVIGLLTGDVDIFINDASTTVDEHPRRQAAGAGDGWSEALAAAAGSADLRRARAMPAVVSSSWFGLAAPVEDARRRSSARLAAAMPQVFASPRPTRRVSKRSASSSSP